MDLQARIQEYLQGPQLLRRAVSGMTQEQLLARPIPGRWSTLEVVCHLADFEPIFADRIKRAIAEDRPTILGANQDLFVQRLAYHLRDLQEELSIIELTRQQLARILRTLAPEDFQRVAVHNQAGPRTVEQLLQTAIRHIPHHIKFIEEKRRALGLPSID
ncbi:MAG: DinB family protein [Gemmatales bacterium]|nr:DinB family protein [Gemmatales bacterium]MCS7161163.1 DinB family protein [Gemmatales bacterium]MDW8176366.1 DinB family protein [Gemmatales bacterium]MDW8221690.1 DinB family protein [Gemmatales bacterium]